MKIIVCIKQVPDTSEVKIDRETNTIIREGVPSIINPYDYHAIEAALTIKEEYGGSVHVLTMGPPQAESALREALSLGANEAILITDKAFAGSDTLATSYILSKVIEKIGFDLIICGKQAIDGDTAQVGPELAEFLNIPHVAYVKKIESVSERSIRLWRLMEYGYDIIESPLPTLFTVVRELNEPRPPSLRGKMAAKKAVIKKITHSDIDVDESMIGLKGSPTKVWNIFPPPPAGERKMIEGSAEQQVEEIIEVLKNMRCI
ncbi:MAG: electron transfer flavoprotein subunit beta/FixA family protein [Nitrospirae bacterium]|nr:MAG: electron transfer flavoprotein subunit beta/FixA family protein [Nitrospirota bacterium]